MFHAFEWSNSTLFEDPDGDQPSELSAWSHGSISPDESGTHFGFVQSGRIKLRCESGHFEIRAGMYFSVPAACEIEGSDSRGILCTRRNYQGFFQIGGPIESLGRLRYIDGCSDSLLIPPVICGDPCLNLLHIPPGTAQTQHTHPSLRAGIIASGEGECRTPERTFRLTPGTIFVIPAESEHSFHTVDSELRVIAWHPDSDTGPRHDDHPMVNRTIVDGVSASQIPEIRT